MAQEQYTTAVGRLTGDPELRFTPSGAAVANFTIAQSERVFDKQSNEWKDGNTNFWACSVWRDMAENVAESLTKGMPVVAHGIVRTQTWDDKQSQQKRSRMVLEVQAIGPDLRWGTAAFSKPNRQGQGVGQTSATGGFANTGGNRAPQQGQSQQAAAGWGAGNDDPWANGGAQYNSSEPPF